MARISKRIATYAKKDLYSLKELMDKFGIPLSQDDSFRRGLKKEKIKLKDNRGRKNIEFK